MVDLLGECPVASAMHLDGVNDGIAAGRACWTIRSCGNRLARAGVHSGNSCHNCEFYRRVLHEEEAFAQHKLSSVLS